MATLWTTSRTTGCCSLRSPHPAKTPTTTMGTNPKLGHARPAECAIWTSNLGTESGSTAGVTSDARPAGVPSTTWTATPSLCPTHRMSHSRTDRQRGGWGTSSVHRAGRQADSTREKDNDHDYNRTACAVGHRDGTR